MINKYFTIILFFLFGCDYSPNRSEKDPKSFEEKNLTTGNLTSIPLNKISQTIQDSLNKKIQNEFNLRFSMFHKQSSTDTFSVTHEPLHVTHHFYQTPFPFLVSLSKGNSSIRLSKLNICNWEYRIVSIISTKEELNVLFGLSGCDLNEQQLDSIQATENGYEIWGNNKLVVKYDPKKQLSN